MGGRRRRRRRARWRRRRRRSVIEIFQIPRPIRHLPIHLDVKQELTKVVIRAVLYPHGKPRPRRLADQMRREVVFVRHALVHLSVRSASPLPYHHADVSRVCRRELQSDCPQVRHLEVPRQGKVHISSGRQAWRPRLLSHGGIAHRVHNVCGAENGARSGTMRETL
jgi:hypothetical protein